MTLSHRTIFNEAPNPHVAFAFGRLNPPHYGHEGLINTLASVAKKGSWALFLSKSQDAKKNPLTYDQKVKWVKVLYPQVQGHLVEDPAIRTFLQAAAYLYDKGFRSATFVAGEDDMASMRPVLEQYNGKQVAHGFYQFEPLSFMESPRLTSATNARQAATGGDVDAFERATRVPQNIVVDGKTLFQAVRIGMGLSETVEESIISESIIAESLSVEQLAHISDKALDDAYHYGLSTPGANFGWLANIESAAAAKRMIDSGITDVDAIASAIHDGWNKTAMADYMGKLQLDTPTIPDKKKKRYALAQQTYGQLPEVEKEKDRVVARAMLKAMGVISEAPGIGGDWGDNPKLIGGKKNPTKDRPNIDNTDYGSRSGANLDLRGLPTYPVSEAAEKNKIDEEMFRGEDGFIDMLEYAKFVVSYETGYELYESIDIENLNYINSLYDEYSIKEPIIGKNYSAIFPMYVGKNTIQMFGHHAPLKLLSIDNDHYIFEKNKRYPIEYESVEGNGIFKTFILDPTMVSQLLTIMELRYNVKSHIVESAEKSTKAEAKYQAMPRNGQRCDHCTMWRPPHGCSAVSGKIAANGWCSYYKRSHRSDLDESADDSYQTNVLKHLQSWFDRNEPQNKLLIQKILTATPERVNAYYRDILVPRIEKFDFPRLFDPKFYDMIANLATTVKQNPPTFTVEEVQPLDEAATDILYHYTGVHAALDILQEKQFKLSSALGSVEAQYAPKGYNYFLSAARSRSGGYHHYTGTSAVMFVLDGRWINQRYPVKAIDYWAGMGRGDRHKETEDRIFSKESAIPTTPITAIHVLLKEANEFQSPITRKLLIAAKQSNIPTYLYKDEGAWRLQDTRRSVSVVDAKTVLRGQEISRYRSKGTRWLKPILDLLTATNEMQLGDRAKKMLQNVKYHWSDENDYYFRDSVHGVETDFSNARKPYSGDYDDLTKIVSIMRQNRIGSIRELMLFIGKKWAPKTEENVNENIDEEKEMFRDKDGYIDMLEYAKWITSQYAGYELYENIDYENINHLNSIHDDYSIDPVIGKEYSVIMPIYVGNNYLNLDGFEKPSTLVKVENNKYTFANGISYPKEFDSFKSNNLIKTMFLNSNQFKEVLMTLSLRFDIHPSSKLSKIEEHAGSILGTVGGGNDYPDRQVATFPWDRWTEPDADGNKVSYIRKSRKSKKR